MDFVPIYSGYACMRRLYIGAKYESRLAWRKHPHLPIYSAKRERTFEVGRFYTVSVSSKVLLFLDIYKYLSEKLYQIRKIILIILYQIPKNNMPKH